MSAPLKTRSRRGRKVYVVDFLYPNTDGVMQRYRRDARVQIKSAAEQEATRLYTEAVRTGRVPSEPDNPQKPGPKGWTFEKAVSFYEENSTKKHTTKHGYSVNFEAHLLPRFRSRPIASIGYADITKLRSALDPEHAVATVNNVEIALRSVLRFAKVNGELATMPELPPLRPVPRRVIQPPCPEDVALVLDRAYESARLPMALAAYAGLRSGEIRGLRFMDVDRDRWLILVRQAVCRGVADVPKSGHERAVPIVEQLKPLIDEAFRRRHKPTDAVSVSSRGEPWAEGSLLHAFQRVLKKAQLPAARVHDLRHFFVTECFRAGVPAPDVQKLAGHLHLHVTQRYAATDETSQREAIAAFSERIKAKSGRGATKRAGSKEAGSNGANGVAPTH
jgi:integrase